MATPSQSFVDIKEIRDGIIILNDGGLRAIVMTTSTNLGLKSQQEQEAVISQFRSFVNTIEFSVQILIQSRRLDIRPYLDTLEARAREVKEELLQIQTREYIEFIKNFTRDVDVMTKNFFIVVAYSGATVSASKSGNSFLKMFGGDLLKSKKKKTSGADQEFEYQRSQLEQRISVVEQGASRFGVRTKVLNTEQVIELFYNAYNPGDTHRRATLPMGEQ
jgi:hypothetical protein